MSTDILCSIPAGRCQVTDDRDGLKKVSPILTEGRIVVVRAGSNFHFFWRDMLTMREYFRRPLHRGNGLRKIKTGNHDDRVYGLDGLGSSSLLFWFQEKDASKDSDMVKQFNSLTGYAIQQSLAKLDFSALLSQPRTMPPVPPATRIGSVSSLSNVISPENVVNSGVLNVPSVQSELMSLLPDGQRDPQDLLRNIRSPEFYHATKHLEELLEEMADFRSFLNDVGIVPPPHQDCTGGVGCFSRFLSAIQAACPAATSLPAPPNSSASNNNNSNNDQHDSTNDKMDVDDVPFTPK